MEYFFIDTQEDLINLCKKMEHQKIIAIDTEFIRRTTFFPIVCLLQVCFDEENAYVIDMLKELDLKKFMEIIYKEDVVKVFHSSYQDLEILFNINKALPKNIFDTQIALLAMGQQENISYDKMLKIILKTYIDKFQKDSIWNVRPLTKSQIIYAANDVFYLFKAYFIIHKLLLENDKYVFLEKKMLELSNEKRYIFNIDEALYKMATNSNPKYLSNLKNLILFRYNEAVKLNLNYNRIIDDSIVEELAKMFDPKVETLAAILTNKNNKKYCDTVFDILNLDIELIKIDKWDNPRIYNKDICKIIEIVLKQIANTIQINPSLIATKQDIEEIVMYKEEAKNDSMVGIRYKIFGSIAIDILNGKKVIFIENDSIVYK
jgi:ribonuclease D